MNEKVRKFAQIFEGLEEGWGQFIAQDTDEKTGKQKGKYYIGDKPITENNFLNHLQGTGPSLGIVPIRKDNTCTWGAIDIDEYTENRVEPKNLIKKIRDLQMPLIPFRSKSDGHHLYLFVKEKIPAATMRKKLDSMAKALGFLGQIEIFPKQEELDFESGDRGNFINIPFYGGNRGVRYMYDDNGESGTVDQFFEAYDKHVVDAEQFQQLDFKKEEKEAEKTLGVKEFKDGPPCLQQMATEKVGHGQRNEFLFMMTTYLKQKFPDDWKDQLDRVNREYIEDPLNSEEVISIKKSTDKKDYGYKCKQSPFCDLCKKDICRKRKYGIGRAQIPEYANPAVLLSEPPVWFLDVPVLDEEGEVLKVGRGKFTTTQLRLQDQFAEACMSNLSIRYRPESMPAVDWRNTINRLMRAATEIKISEDASEYGEFVDHLEDFCVNRARAVDKIDILDGKPYTEEGYTMFRLKDLQRHLKGAGFKNDRSHVISLLYRYKYEDFNTSVRSSRDNKTKFLRLIKIKAFAEPLEPDDPPNMDLPKETAF